MFYPKLVAALSIVLLLDGIANADLISVESQRSQGNVNVSVAPLVDEGLIFDIEVRNDQIRITARTWDGEDEQAEDIEYTRIDGEELDEEEAEEAAVRFENQDDDNVDDEDYIAVRVDLRIEGTTHSDEINIEFQETINLGTTFINVFAGDGDDDINVTDRRADRPQLVNDPLLTNVVDTLRMMLWGGDGDDIIMNLTQAASSQIGGGGWDTLQGGRGYDFFCSESFVSDHVLDGDLIVIVDNELDLILDAGGTASIIAIAVPVVDRVTTLHRPVRAITDYTLGLKTKPIVSKSKLDQLGGIPETSISLPNKIDFSLPNKGDGVEAYAVKTTYRWQLLNEYVLETEPSQFQTQVIFCDPVGNLMFYVGVTNDPNWEAGAPTLEPLIEEL